MKERPILFSTPMVRAILDGSKTQTRRVVKGGVPEAATAILNHQGAFIACDEQAGEVLDACFACPYGEPGDRLWVKETFYACGRWETRYDARKRRHEWYFIDMTVECHRAYLYAAESPQARFPLTTDRSSVIPGWWKRSPLFMPRAASRISLEVTRPRVERLNDCSEEDAIAEGLIRSSDGWRGAPELPWFASPVSAYRSLWESINGAGSWDKNPWVWAVEFKRVDRRPGE